MEISTDEKRLGIIVSIAFVIWLIIAFTFNVLTEKVLVITIALYLSGIAIHFFNRKNALLGKLIKAYGENEDLASDVEMALVQAYYGRYRLALVTLKLELKKNPNDKQLLEIVNLIEEIK